jgi:hypothetical protein
MIKRIDSNFSPENSRGVISINPDPRRFDLELEDCGKKHSPEGALNPKKSVFWPLRMSCFEILNSYGKIPIVANGCNISINRFMPISRTA